MDPAWFCRQVSKGRTRNATGPGILAMKRANVSGGCRMTSYSTPQASAHSRAITRKALTNALFGRNSTCTIAVIVFPNGCPAELDPYCAETRRNLDSFKWERPAWEEAIASRVRRQQEIPQPKSNRAYFLSPSLSNPSLRRNVIIGQQFVKISLNRPCVPTSR